MPITGECFCGRIQYQIAGPLRDARSCHCSRCRKAFSAQASAYALVEPGTLTWTAGEAHLSHYDSAQGFGLRFCQYCGSTLCGTYQGEVHGVTLGCVNGDPDVEINYHLYVDSKAAWEVMPADVVCYAEAPPKDC